LIDIWSFIADDNPNAADRLLDRLQTALEMLRDNPEAGRSRSELAASVRSFPVGRYILFYRVMASSLELVRVLSGHRDVQADDIR
jgi:toxin ParE1/3/4